MGKFKDVGDPSLTLAEECAEVIQVIAKKARFNGSWFEIPEGKSMTRYQELCAEMEDVMYQWERLKAEIESEGDQLDQAFIDDQHYDQITTMHDIKEESENNAAV